jgi:nicotinamide-nucleotide amidase
MYAEILTIGDELCRGEIIDTNSSGMAAKLWDLQITPRWMTSCRDDVADMKAAITLAVSRSDLVVISGGLGPTEDDLTVDVVAELAGRGVTVDELARANMEKRFAGRLDINEIQLRQVRVPEGATVWGNPAGLAPGFEVEIAGVPVFCVPGIPREVWSIYDSALAARFAQLRAARGNAPAIYRRIYRVFGKGESVISQACRGLVDGVVGASIHYQVKYPETLVKLVVSHTDAAYAEATLRELEQGLRQRVGDHLYGADLESLPERVCRKLRQSKYRVATAESCTGGMLAELLTAPAGASSYFVGAAVCYSNEEKTRALGVAPEIFVQHGAVSEQCVTAMAQGALERFGVDIAVAISGIAGPDGGSADKPVGTVHLALAHRLGDEKTMEIVHKTYAIGFARDQVRILAAWWALAMIDKVLPKEPWV